MKQERLTSQLVQDWLKNANLCPFSGQIRESRNLVNKLARTNFTSSTLLGNLWTLKTAKGYQFISVKFPDVQGCGFDGRPISQ